MINILVSNEFAGVTFIRDYLQLLFDGPVLNVYSWPVIKDGESEVKRDEYGFCDTICGFIGAKVIRAFEYEGELVVEFGDGNKIVISLKYEDRSCANAAILQRDKNGEWCVWQRLVHTTM